MDRIRHERMLDADVNSKRATRGVKKASESGLTPLVNEAATLRITVTLDAADVRKYDLVRRYVI